MSALAKRPMSTYFLWLNENRPKIVAKHPTASAKDIAQFAGAEWAALTAAAKKKYEDIYKKDHARYEKEIADHPERKPKNKSRSAKKASSGRKKKDENAPKRTSSAFIYYSSEHRPKLQKQFPDLKLTDISKKLGEGWANLKDRKKYEALASKDQERYKSEMENYVPPEPTANDKKSKKAKKDPNAPKRPPSAYFLWVADNRARLVKANPTAKVTEIAKLAGAEWKTISAKDKKKYEDLAAKDKTRYEKEVAAYKKA